MASRPVIVRRVGLHASQITPTPRAPRPSNVVHVQKQLASIGTNARPSIPFLAKPRTGRHTLARTYVSERTKQWLRHEFKMFIRLGALVWGGGACLSAIYLLYLEETVERDYPTPHEWTWRTRKRLRDAHKWTDPKHKPMPSFVYSFGIVRNLILLLEDPNLEGDQIPRLHNHEEPDLEVSWEFIPHDITGMSEEWRRGYYDANMLAAKSAEHIDGWVREVDDAQAYPPEVVIGPSNPRPTPMPPGAPFRAPREEDCVLAFPPADRYYLKILATIGYTTRQRIGAMLEYANFLEHKKRPEEAESLYQLALAEATQGIETAQLPYKEKSLVLKENGPTPSLNILDSLTGIANQKARAGDINGALPIYLSLLKARRSLSNTAPPDPGTSKPRSRSFFGQVVDLVSEPDYPPPPPDGTQPPWRSPEQRCHEAALHIYIGEILYATKSREDGLAWTREGVDVAEEQLQSFAPIASRAERGPKRTCGDCLRTGLDNWTVMVKKLVEDDKRRRETESSRSGILSFWGSGSEQTQEGTGGRWDAETAVVEERVRRTKHILDEVKPPPEGVRIFYQA